MRYMIALVKMELLVYCFQTLLLVEQMNLIRFFGLSYYFFAVPLAGAGGAALPAFA